ncbi:MAG TPA: HAMP domain-containing sensor histidine kinase [Solirubrobacteraceae bacterium]|jgi:two-component system OmpR family sensor kinase|nr:HAMP domain-containing sensor histidine kinase [Solirubrobacteraceae bacterium]
MSLRARLIAGLLVLAAVGLVVLAGVTYAEQRSFMLQRIDQQAATAVPILGHAFDDQSSPLPGGGQPDDGDRGGPTVSLPPGTYGEQRSPTGKRIGTPVVLSYGQASTARPKLPRTLPAGDAVTVGSTSGDVRYRALALPIPRHAGTIVVAIPLTETDQTLNRLLLVEGLVIAAVLLALGAGAWWLVRLGLRPLDRMGTTAGAIAAGDLSRRITPATQRTEVGRLGLALNAMLARLEEAFARRQASEDRLRRFLADASHELRTPLASIRGYAELFRIGAARSPEDTEKAMQRIEQEAARMGVLVEDLLTLARLDEEPDTRRELADLAEIARETTDDARATAPDRAIEVGAAAPALVHADPDRLRQVVGNLMRNALVHTPAGTPVDVGVVTEGAWVELSVRDHGPGLPDEDPDALFERFWRAEGGRERGRAGAGLGLAIVAGIVHAHGGSVTASNAPDGGARFVVRLPAAHSQEELRVDPAASHPAARS